jgi:2,4'-dihydroxyacetophenone dioxygenase
MTSLDDLEIDTEHLHGDELPWVANAAGGSSRILLARERDSLVVMHWRAAPGTASGVHRHLGSVLVFTLAGTWSHRADVMEYRPGTYVSEPVGALHRFFAGPDEVEAIGYSFGDTEAVNAEGEVVGVATLETKVAEYYKACEEQGFGRPNILH